MLTALAAKTTFAGPVECDNLATLSLTDTVITSTTYIDASSELPGYCEVQATVGPQTDVIVRLPDNWRYRYFHLGGAGFDGQFPPDLNGSLAFARKNPITDGYVVVASNGGHRASDYPGGSFSSDAGLALSYASKAIHDSDVVGKAMVEAYYGKPADYRYFAGCSNGGKNSSHAAGIFADGYDGVIAGAGTYGHGDDGTGGTGMSGLVAKWAQVFQNTPDSLAAKATAVHAAEVALCDVEDGLKDGIISNPANCDFDPASMRCPEGVDDNTCLNDVEIHALNIMRSDLVNAAGDVIGAPYAVGDMTIAKSRAMALRGGFLSLAYGTGEILRDGNTFDLERDFSHVKTVLDKVYGMTSDRESMARYLKRGKKLIFWHGWHDDTVPAWVSPRIYNALRKSAGREGRKNLRLYMMPGVGHCQGGSGADAFDLLSAMSDWVEAGIAPDGRVTAEKIDPDTGEVLLTRPLCEYPTVPIYKAHLGSPDDANSFVCRMPRRHHKLDWDDRNDDRDDG
jgi:feruloyl esterase